MFKLGDRGLGYYFDRKYIEEISPRPQTFLFDVESDPAERANLAEEETWTVDALAALLEGSRIASRGSILFRAVGEADGGARTVTATVRTKAELAMVEPGLYRTEVSDAIFERSIEGVLD